MFNNLQNTGDILMTKSSARLDFNSFSVIDLFCGIGGLSHGFVLEGFKVNAGIDFDESCRFAFESNNKSKFIHKDISDVTSIELDGYFSKNKRKILVGCAPCQAFSQYMFKDKEKDNNKWTLLYEFGRLIEETQPDIISMENVSQLLNFKKAPVFEDFIALLKKEGYFFSYQIVYCPDYGIPQNRKRLVLLASKFGEINLIDKTHSRENYKTVRDVIGQLPVLEDGQSDSNDRFHFSRKLSALNKKRIRSTPYGGSWKDWPDDLVLECHKKETGKSYPSIYGRMKWETQAPTITTHCIGYGNGRFGHPEQHRGISLREAALLQTFPMSYEFFDKAKSFSSSAIARQLGNAVPVVLGQVIAKSINHHLKNLDNEN
ncbi:MAG: DNA (cytosine-5-)-methyltransferase [Parafilimonas sp.]